MTPKTEWPIIARETIRTGDVFTSYVMPLAAIGPVAMLIGSPIFGIGFVILSYVAGLAGVLIMTFIVEQLSPKFGGEQSRTAAFRLIAYSGTAGWLAGIFNLVSSISFLAILGSLYSIYLFYLGCGPMLKIPQDKRVVFMVVVAIVGIAISMVIGVIVGSILGVGSLMGV
ncbi:Yip1 family protein [Sphingobium sp. CR28]|uniref:Yip1 family protein n=1 Tax=Sphingobium sp. CR28 TaxID=3400272 RepID=UPI003FEDD60E